MVHKNHSITHARDAAPDTLPSDYESWKAADKQAYLYAEAERDMYLNGLPVKAPLPPINLIKLFSKNGRELFKQSGDLKPKDFKRSVHPYGAVCDVVFEPVQPSPVATGLLATRSYGIVRLSKLSTVVNGPGIAWKILRDGEASVNVFGVNSLRGQGNNHNFFARTLSNNAPVQGPRHPIERSLQDEANLIKEHANHLTSSVLGTLPDGVVIDPIEFRPAEDVKHLISENSLRDYRRDMIDKFKPGMALYEIWTKKTVGGKEVKLGVLRLTSGVVASQVGDRIRFQHPVDANFKDVNPHQNQGKK